MLIALIPFTASSVVAVFLDGFTSLRPLVNQDQQRNTSAIVPENEIVKNVRGKCLTSQTKPTNENFCVLYSNKNSIYENKSHNKKYHKS